MSVTLYFVSLNWVCCILNIPNPPFMAIWNASTVSCALTLMRNEDEFGGGPMCRFCMRPPRLADSRPSSHYPRSSLLYLLVLVTTFTSSEFSRHHRWNWQRPGNPRPDSPVRARLNFSPSPCGPERDHRSFLNVVGHIFSWFPFRVRGGVGKRRLTHCLAHSQRGFIVIETLPVYQKLFRLLSFNINVYSPPRNYNLLFLCDRRDWKDSHVYPSMIKGELVFYRAVDQTTDTTILA